MSSPSVMLTREFYRNVRPEALVGISLLLVVILIHAVIGFGDSPSPFLVAVCIGFAGLALSATTPRPHHLNLPLTANHLSGILLVNAGLVGIVSIAVVLQFIGLVFDRPWNGLTLAMLGTSACLVFVPLARLIAGQSAELFGVFVSCNFGWWLSRAITNHHWFFVAMASIAMAALGWRLLVMAVNRERRGAPTLSGIIEKWELSLSKKRGAYRCRFSEPRQAVFQLDWMRFRFGVIGVSLALVIGFGVVPLLIDPSILVLPLVGTFMPAIAALTTGSFMEADWKANGDFRWNLPVADADITRGLRKDVALTLLVILLACHVTFVMIVLYLHATDQLSLTATNKHSLFPGNIAKLLLVSTLAVPVQFAIGWVSAMRGLEASLLGRVFTGRQFVWSCVWCVGLYVAIKYVPASAQSLAFGLLLGWAGIALLMRTERAFRWAKNMKVVSADLLPRSLTIWLLGSIICVGSLLYLGYHNIGLHVLSVGLLAALFQPTAALPIAVHLRRHFC